MLNKNVLNGHAVPGRLPGRLLLQSHPDKTLGCHPCSRRRDRALELWAPQQCPEARCTATPSPPGLPLTRSPEIPRSGPALTHLQGEQASVRSAPSRNTASRGGSSACLVFGEFVSLPLSVCLSAPCSFTEALSAGGPAGRRQLPPPGLWQGRELGAESWTEPRALTGTHSARGQGGQVNVLCPLKNIYVWAFPQLAQVEDNPSASSPASRCILG